MSQSTSTSTPLPSGRSLSDLARDAAISATAEQADHGSRIFDPYDAAVERTRTKLARLIGAGPGEIAFMRNTVEALSVVASGFAWRAGDNIVFSGLEFSGNAYPWLNLARFGVSCRFVPSRDGAVDVDSGLGTFCRSVGIRLGGKDPSACPHTDSTQWTRSIR